MRISVLLKVVDYEGDLEFSEFIVSNGDAIYSDMTVMCVGEEMTGQEYFDDEALDLLIKDSTVIVEESDYSNLIIGLFNMPPRM